MQRPFRDWLAEVADVVDPDQHTKPTAVGRLIYLRMSNSIVSAGVVVVFTDGRQMTLANAKSAHFLKPGVEVCDTAGKVLFRSRLEVLSVRVHGQPVMQKRTDDDLLA